MIRMLAWSVTLPVLKYILPLPTLVRLMRCGTPRMMTGQHSDQEPTSLIRLISALALMQGRCLERSLLLYRILSDHHASAELAIGLRKIDGKWSGHAWVLVDGQPYGESVIALQGFVPLLVFCGDEDAFS